MLIGIISFKSKVQAINKPHDESLIEADLSSLNVHNA